MLVFDGNTQRLTKSGFMEKPGNELATPGLQDMANNCLWSCSLAVPVLAGWVYGFVQEHPKAQPAVVLVLKRLRRRGNGLKSHPTDWEKPGIEPATPGLQDIGLSRHSK